MSEQKDFMLTTFDNSFNPFTDFDRWFKEDLRLGHHCCELLSLNANTSNMISDERNKEIINEAIDDICRRSPTIYRKVSIDDY